MQSAFSRVSRRGRLALLASTVVGLAGAGAASAAAYTVNTTTDTTTCSSSSCTLRGAVIAADTAGGASTIDVPAGLYKLTIASTGTDDPATGDLDIQGGATVTIHGAGSGSTILDGNNVGDERGGRQGVRPRNDEGWVGQVGQGQEEGPDVHRLRPTALRAGRL